MSRSVGRIFLVDGMRLFGRQQCLVNPFSRHQRAWEAAPAEGPAVAAADGPAVMVESFYETCLGNYYRCAAGIDRLCSDHNGCARCHQVGTCIIAAWPEC